MAYPVPVVEIAFSDGPYVVSPTWTDVTAYVTDLSTSRGRDDDWGRFTGTAQVTLLNNDRRFDPFYTSGPYYGNLKPRRQIRIRSTWNGNTYDVFRGFIQGWPPAWTDAGKMSTVTLSCFDALDLLGSAPMPVDFASDYMITLGAQHLWLMDDPIIGSGTAATLTDSGTKPANLLSNTSIYQAESLASGIDSTCAGSSTNLLIPNSTNLPYAWGSVSDFSLSVWTKNTESQGNGSTINLAANGLAFEMAHITQVTSGDGHKFRFRVRNMSIGWEWFTTTTFIPNEPYHVVFIYNSTTQTATAYVNGISCLGTRLAYSTLFAPFTNENLSLGYSEYQHLGYFGRALTSTEASNIYQFSLQQLSETSAQRTTRIVNYTSFPTALVSANGTQNVLDIPATAGTAREQLDLVENTEYGPLFVSRSGVLTQMSQTQTETQSSSIVSSATFGSGGQPIGPSVELQYDGDAIRNKANVSMGTAGTVTIANATSVSQFGESDYDLNTITASVEAAKQLGYITTGWGGQVYPDADEVEVVMSPAGTWSSVLNLELCDRFTLAVQPPTGNAITVPMLLGKVRHEAQPGRWRSFVTGSARWAAVFILDQSKLDSTDLLG